MVSLRDGNQDLDVVGLYRGICCRTFDQLEPYVAVEGDRPACFCGGLEERAPPLCSQDFAVPCRYRSFSFHVTFIPH